jgi:hypothetical protein
VELGLGGLLLLKKELLLGLDGLLVELGLDGLLLVELGLGGLLLLKKELLRGLELVQH